MNLLFRSFIMIPRKLFIKRITSAKCIFMHSINNNKKFTPFLQSRHFSIKSNKEVKEVLIYKGSHKSIYVIKVFYIACLLLCPVAIVYGLVNVHKLSNNEKSEYWHTLISYIIFVFLAHYVLKRYVVKMYYNPQEKKYTVTTMGHVLRTKQMTFTENDIILPNIWHGLATCVVQGQSLMFMNSNFSDVRHLTIMEKTRKLKDYEVEKLETAPQNQIPSTGIKQQIESKSTTQKKVQLDLRSK